MPDGLHKDRETGGLKTDRAFRSEDQIDQVEGMVIKSHTYYKPEPGPGGVQEILGVLDHSLEVKARPAAVQ